MIRVLDFWGEGWVNVWLRKGRRKLYLWV